MPSPIRTFRILPVSTFSDLKAKYNVPAGTLFSHGCNGLNQNKRVYKNNELCANKIVELGQKNIAIYFNCARIILFSLNSLMIFYGALEHQLIK